MNAVAAVALGVAAAGAALLLNAPAGGALVVGGLVTVVWLVVLS